MTDTGLLTLMVVMPAAGLALAVAAAVLQALIEDWESDE